MIAIVSVQEPVPRAWAGVSTDYLVHRVETLTEDEGRVLGALVRTGDMVLSGCEILAGLIETGLIEIVGEEARRFVRPTLAGAAVYGTYTVLMTKRIDQHLTKLAKARPIRGR